MRIEVDRDRCDAHGLCQTIAPEVFALRGDKLEYDATPDSGLRDDVEQAVGACPAQAITLHE